MKIHPAILLVLMSASMIIFSCKGRNDLIVNKWTITEVKTDSLHKQPDSVFAPLYNSIVEFKSDGSFQAFTNGKTGSPNKGTWRVSSDGKELYSTNQGGLSTDTMKILELSGNKMILSQKDVWLGSLTITMVSK